MKYCGEIWCVVEARAELTTCDNDKIKIYVSKRRRWEAPLTAGTPP